MQLRRRARRPLTPELSLGTPTPSRSAAWLAGEQLFEAAPAPVPVSEASVVVTIRRSKLPTTVAAAEGMHDAADAADAPEGADWKGPRVFRLEAASNEAAPGPELAEVQPAEPLPAAPVPRRRQRIGVDRRPGPVVVQVFQAEPAAEAAEPPFAEQLRLLRAALAEVERLISDTQRAQALRFVAG